ncbi:MAG: formylglycine-generating enzyme family protein [Abitibacteriaceae bacterium]|nr:formylglycine-generating enzyme family protein [Abditibacteriaceae bacterium]
MMKSVFTVGTSLCCAALSALFLPGCRVQESTGSAAPVATSVALTQPLARPIKVVQPVKKAETTHVGVVSRPPGPAPKGMVWIPAGQFWMSGPPQNNESCRCATSAKGKPICAGLLSGFTDAQPGHAVYVDGFWMDATEVTNAQFSAFVRATGYVTVAERKPDPAQFPGADPALLVPGSIVFTPPKTAVPLDNVNAWWSYVPGANWRHPSGPHSTLKGKENFPVVQVAYEDAAAYAKWADKRLPTEAEWERAARGGQEREPYVWGKQLKPGGRWQCNAFQGEFPYHDTAEDGYAGLAPVAHFAPNHYHLYDMAGNVWEWCSDWYRPDYYAQLAAQGGVAHNPHGPTQSYDPDEPGVPKRVQRGGSFLCSDQYCARYLLGTRGKGAVDTGSSHVGFRCVRAAR